MDPESVDATLHTSRKRSGCTLPRPRSRTTWRRIDGAEGFPELVASFVSWQKILTRVSERGRDRPLFTPRRGDQALTNGGGKSKYSWWILEMGEDGGSGSAISASSPRPALKEKCLAADRRVHSPRVVAAGILSGILMAIGVQQHPGTCALNAAKDPSPHEGTAAPPTRKDCRERARKTTNSCR